MGLKRLYYMKMIHMVTFVLLIVGGLNWGLTAFGYNVVEMVFGNWPVVVKVVYTLVGLAAVYEIVTHKTNCKNCTSCTSGTNGGNCKNCTSCTTEKVVQGFFKKVRTQFF